MPKVLLDCSNCDHIGGRPFRRSMLHRPPTNRRHPCFAQVRCTSPPASSTRLLLKRAPRVTLRVTSTGMAEREHGETPPLGATSNPVTEQLQAAPIWRLFERKCFRSLQPPCIIGANQINCATMWDGPISGARLPRGNVGCARKERLRGNSSGKGERKWQNEQRAQWA